MFLPKNRQKHIIVDWKVKAINRPGCLPLLPCFPPKAELIWYEGKGKKNVEEQRTEAQMIGALKQLAAGLGAGQGADGSIQLLLLTVVRRIVGGQSCVCYSNGLSH